MYGWTDWMEKRCIHISVEESQGESRSELMKRNGLKGRRKKRILNPFLLLGSKTRES